MKSDIFKFFSEMNKGNFDYIDQMSDEEVKDLSPYVLLMWCHGAVSNTFIHVMLTDMYCNQKVFSLAKHPRLLLKLFVEANGDIDNTRYQFKKSVGKESDKKTKAIASFYQCSLKEAKDYAKILSDDDIKEIIRMEEDG